MLHVQHHFYFLNHPSCPVVDNLCTEIDVAVTLCEEAFTIRVSTTPEDIALGRNDWLVVIAYIVLQHIAIDESVPALLTIERLEVFMIQLHQLFEVEVSVLTLCQSFDYRL